MTLRHCPCCGREADLSALTSALTGEEGEGCITCAMANAEPLSAVYAASSSDERWQAIPIGIRKAATVYEGGIYIPVHQWARRVAARALVVVKTDDEWTAEEDRLLDSIMERLEEVRPRSDFEMRAPRETWLERTMTRIGEHVRIIRAIAAAKMGAWRVA